MQEDSILWLRNVIRESMNPMTREGEDLMIIITKVVMPDEVQKMSATKMRSVRK